MYTYIFGAVGTTVPYLVEAFGRLSEGIESAIIYPSFSQFTALPHSILYGIVSSTCLDVSSASILSRTMSRMAWLQLVSPYAPAVVIHACWRGGAIPMCSIGLNMRYNVRSTVHPLAWVNA